jgi:NADH:ubiquinone oxidoreductase subunit 4 (subunit M)
MANPAFNLKSTALDRQPRHSLSPGRGWHLALAGGADRLSGPAGRAGFLENHRHRTKEFYFFFLLQQTAMIGVFVALDMFLYYAFWELTLVPMAILISMFGRDRGTEAAIKFFIYTFLPSALLLVAIVWLYAKTGTFDFVRLQSILAQDTVGLPAPGALLGLAGISRRLRRQGSGLSPAWLAGDVFSEAPTAMAMVVAGKLGLYSILRFNLGLFPAQARQVAPWMIALAVIGILYGALVALVQKDMKRLVAFSTVSSLSFCILGIFCFAVSGLDGAVYQTLNEGISVGALLCCSASCTNVTEPTRLPPTAAWPSACPAWRPCSSSLALAGRPAAAEWVCG